MSDAKLKPCPLDGKCAKVAYSSGSWGYSSSSAKVECSACGCAGPMALGASDHDTWVIEEAARLWNHRVDPQREAMRSALEAIVAVGPPVRGVDELWSSWQARLAAYEQARAALEVK